MKTRMDLGEATELASELIEHLRPGCERIEAAGSLRRLSPWVGDLELVAIPRRRAGLFGAGQGDSLLDDALRQLTRLGFLIPGRSNGPRYKQYLLADRAPSFQLDLFIVTAATWGVQLALRTGPADFSRAIVTTRSYGGLLRDGHYVCEGRVRRSGHGIEEDLLLDTPEEADFLALAGGWLPPEQRNRRGFAVDHQERFRARLEARRRHLDERTAAAGDGGVVTDRHGQRWRVGPEHAEPLLP